MGNETFYWDGLKVLNVITFGPKCNKPLVLTVINPLLHLGPNFEASNVITVPKCNKLRGAFI